MLLQHCDLIRFPGQLPRLSLRLNTFDMRTNYLLAESWVTSGNLTLNDFAVSPVVTRWLVI